MNKKLSTPASLNEERPVWRCHHTSLPRLGFVAIWALEQPEIWHTAHNRIRNHPLVRPGIGSTNCSSVAKPNDLMLGSLDHGRGWGGPGHPKQIWPHTWPKALLNFQGGRNEGMRELQWRGSLALRGISAGGVSPLAKNQHGTPNGEPCAFGGCVVKANNLVFHIPFLANTMSTYVGDLGRPSAYNIKSLLKWVMTGRTHKIKTQTFMIIASTLVNFLHWNSLRLCPWSHEFRVG